MRVWRGEGKFLEFLKLEPKVIEKLSDDELEALFDISYHTKYVETIFDRVFS